MLLKAAARSSSSAAACVQLRVTSEMLRYAESLSCEDAAAAAEVVVGSLRLVAGNELRFVSDRTAWTASLETDLCVECYRGDGDELQEVGPVVGRCLSRPVALDESLRSDVRRRTELARERAKERKILTIAKVSSKPPPTPNPKKGREKKREAPPLSSSPAPPKRKKPKNDEANERSVLPPKEAFLLLRGNLDQTRASDLPKCLAVGVCFHGPKNDLAAAWQRDAVDDAERRAYLKFATAKDAAAAAKDFFFRETTAEVAAAGDVSFGVDLFCFPPPEKTKNNKTANQEDALLATRKRAPMMTALKPTTTTTPASGRTKRSSAANLSSPRKKREDDEEDPDDVDPASQRLEEVIASVLSFLPKVDLGMLGASIRTNRGGVLRYEPQPTFDVARAKDTYRRWKEAKDALKENRLLLELQDRAPPRKRPNARSLALKFARTVEDALDAELELLFNVLLTANITPAS